MRISLTAAAAVTAASVVTGVTGVFLVGCSSHPNSPTATSKPATSTISTGASQGSTTPSGPASAPAQPTDYTQLLIQASDIKAPETFTAGPPVNNPSGQPGVAATFSNPDRSHVIYDTIQVLSDPVAATNALNARKGGLDGVVHGNPEPSTVGTGGTNISGPSPDATKGVTVLLFTEGKAFVELEFDGPAGSPAPPDFVIDVGQNQDAAIKKGLGG
jgi:hypothetical protein